MKNCGYMVIIVAMVVTVIAILGIVTIGFAR